MFNTWKTMAIAARINRLSAGLLVLSGAVLMTAHPPAAMPAPAATTTTLAVKAGGNAVTSVPSGTVVTLTAAVLAGSTPGAQGEEYFCAVSRPHFQGVAL